MARHERGLYPHAPPNSVTGMSSMHCAPPRARTVGHDAVELGASRALAGERTLRSTVKRQRVRARADAL